VSIISSIPYPNFIDGVTVASGAQVNANNVSIISQVNANAATSGANTNIISLSNLTSPPSGLGSIVFFGGTSTGTNTIVVGTTLPTGFSLLIGNRLAFVAANAPTGACTLTANGTTATAISKWLNGSLTALTGGEWSAGQLVEVEVTSSGYQLVTPYQPATPPTIIYPGEIRMFGMLTPPSLWYLCEGQAVSRTTYSLLYNAIGTTFGVGNGTTTFNLPNMNGQFPRGQDFGGAVDPGRTFGSTQAFANQDHAHGVAAGSAGGNFVCGTGGVGGPLAGGGSFFYTENPETGTQATGNTGVAETRPTNVSLAFAIYAGA
jgi:hypothetical protein